MAGQIPRLQGKIQSQVRNENGLTSGIHKLTGKQTGKKKVKAIARALQKATRSPYTPSSHPRTPSGLPTDRTTLQQTTPNCPASFPLSDKRRNSTDHAQQNHNSPTPAKTGNPASSVPRSTPVPRSERQPLHSPGSRFSAAPVGSYGSIVATPPQQASAASDMASLELPGPAIDPGDDTHEHDDNRKIGSSHSNHSVRIESPQVSPRQPNPGSADGKSSTTKNRPHSSSDAGAKRKSQLLKLVFPGQDWDSGPEKHAQAEATSESERRQDEFFVFLDDELAKIESFYRMKEEESSRRLQMLRRQLHMMRDQRIQEVMAGAKKIAKKHDGKMGALKPGGLAGFKGNRLKDVFTGRNRFGENTEALEGMATTPGTLQSRDPETVTRQRDFSRRPDEDDSPNADVSYRSAKRKLKYALQEFYRGLELLKGYAYLNRTAFRKINKKYDKTVQARPTLRYISENVNKAWFVRSEVTENLMVATEDLYARYFERGNRKLAISKLRRTDKKAGDYSSNTFRSGLLLMAGLLFGIQSLIYVGQHMKSDDVTFRVQTSYLLQIYGGFFLVIFHFLLFCGDCMIWTKSKVNHIFVFEFDTRHALEWRQLLEVISIPLSPQTMVMPDSQQLPSFFFFLLGLFMWLNFLAVNDMYTYWPVVLVGLTLIILFLPFRVLYHRSRKWWAYSNVYTQWSSGTSSLEICIALRLMPWGHWSDPPQCNSSHSRLLGFFQCLPAVWRAFQCLRRYSDTKNMFPHLMNFGKYIFSVLYYATLSMYRIQKVTRFEAPFITFALLNGVYTSVWDLAMDWSLGNPYAKHPLLREVLAFRQVWVYYVAMILDVVVRFNWIFYAIFAHDLQHSAVLSFMVSFSEVCRRGLWTIFRVENEHCTNVLLFRASRDTPLPYDLPKPHEDPDSYHPNDVQLQEHHHQASTITAQPSGATDVEHGPKPSTPAGASVRTRRPSRAAAGIHRVGTIVASAHAQDFERRKRPEQMHPSSGAQGTDQTPDNTSEEEDDNDDAGDADASGDADENLAGELPFTGTRRTSEKSG